MNVEKLNFIVERILGADNQTDYIAGAKELSAFYIEIANSEKHLVKDNYKNIDGGLALSGLHAADCINDYIRTALFIQGVNMAIRKLCSMFPERKINVLYAGTGPFATLFLPLLHRFDNNHVKAILLDINKSSVESVRELVQKMNLTDYDLQFATGDATQYVIPNNFPVDLVISETMHYGLTSEPQVAIIRNLAPQMPPHALLIPENIHIDLGFSFFAKEPFLTLSPDAPKGYSNLQPYEHRIIISRLFTIDKKLFIDYPSDTKKFISEVYTLPENFIDHPDICLYTTVDIFQGIRLNTAESLITNPYCIASLYNLNGSDLQLTYDFSETPQWSYIIQ